MTEQAHQIFKEIEQIIRQYRQEVPGTRRAWPESVRLRVLRLSDVGLSAKYISEVAGLPYFTILNWIPKDKRRRYRRPKSDQSVPRNFSLVQVKDTTPVATVTVPSQAVAIVATVTVTLPNGIRLDGVTPEFLSAWLSKGALP